MLGEDCYEEYGHYSHVPPLSFPISYSQFELHYRAVSSVIYSDEYFDMFVRSTWNSLRNELPKSRATVISQYSNRVQTADFESVMKSKRKK